jgi:hypothetical protein
MTPSRVIALSLAVALAGAAGCADRLHLSASHGRSSQAAFAQQQANPQAASKPRPLPGFDAQEASAVSSNYRRSLVAKEVQVRDQGLLMLGPSAAPAQAYVPPPSVPQEQK